MSRSFEKAAQLDPNAAMPLWGVVFAVGSNYNDVGIRHTREGQALDAISKVEQLPANGPALERDYIAALAARFAQNANHDLPCCWPSRPYARTYSTNASATSTTPPSPTSVPFSPTKRTSAASASKAGQPSMYNGMYYTHNQQPTFIYRDATISTAVKGAA